MAPGEAHRARLCLPRMRARVDQGTQARGWALPGVQPDLEQILKEGDRVALFHLKSMWPFQYRDGAALTPELARAAKQPYHQRQQPV